MNSDDLSIRYAAIGDSFSEGVGDELGDGSMRGWADLAAQGWAGAFGEPIAYANFAVRGRMMEQIATEQLERALALGPTHISINGGGNDLLRPRADLERILGFVEHAVERCAEDGVHLLLLTGGNPCARLPLGARFQRRGDALAYGIEDRFASRPGATVTHNWFDEELASARFWTQDRLHMNARGHHRVAARILTVLGISPPQEWWHLPQLPTEERELRRAAYYRAHIGPWIKRRVTRTSSGDGRSAKHHDWVRVDGSRLAAITGSR